MEPKPASKPEIVNKAPSAVDQLKAQLSGSKVSVDNLPEINFPAIENEVPASLELPPLRLKSNIDAGPPVEADGPSAEAEQPDETDKNDGWPSLDANPTSDDSDQVALPPSEPGIVNTVI